MLPKGTSILPPWGQTLQTHAIIFLSIFLPACSYHSSHRSVSFQTLLIACCSYFEGQYIRDYLHWALLSSLGYCWLKHGDLRTCWKWMFIFGFGWKIKSDGFHNICSKLPRSTEQWACGENGLKIVYPLFLTGHVMKCNSESITNYFAYTSNL